MPDFTRDRDERFPMHEPLNRYLRHMQLGCIVPSYWLTQARFFLEKKSSQFSTFCWVYSLTYACSYWIFT